MMLRHVMDGLLIGTAPSEVRAYGRSYGKSITVDFFQIAVSSETGSLFDIFEFWHCQ